MHILDTVFYLFAVLIIGSASMVVFSKNVMRAAFSLLFTFFGVAGLYVLLTADFVALTQIMVYIGGILILIIFGVMLTNKISGIDINSGISGKIQRSITGATVAIVGISLILMYSNSNWFIAPSETPLETISPIGTLLLTKYLLAFEVVAVLLLIAFVGAAVIARRGE